MIYQHLHCHNHPSLSVKMREKILTATSAQCHQHHHHHTHLHSFTLCNNSITKYKYNKKVTEFKGGAGMGSVFVYFILEVGEIGEGVRGKLDLDRIKMKNQTLFCDYIS